MSFEVFFDSENKTVVLKMLAMPSADDVHQFMSAAVEMFKEMEKKNVLIDTTSNPTGSLDKFARKAFMEYADSVKTLDKIAVYGAKPIPRMMAKIAAAAIGKLDSTKFFKTREQALEWLRK